MTIGTVASLGSVLSSLTDSSGEVLKGLNGSLPADAGISDRDTLLKTSGTLSGHLLVSLVDVGLDHHTGNGVFAGADLCGDVGGDLWLVLVVFVGVTYDMLVRISALKGIASSCAGKRTYRVSSQPS